MILMQQDGKEKNSAELFPFHPSPETFQNCKLIVQSDSFSTFFFLILPQSNVFTNEQYWMRGF